MSLQDHHQQVREYIFAASNCGSCVRATWSNHRVAKALDHPSITRTNEGRFCSQVDKWWHCVHLPHQELVCFMDNAELDTVVPLKNQKPHRGLVFFCFFRKSCRYSSGNSKRSSTCTEYTKRINRLIGGVEAKVRRRLSASPI